MDLARQGPRKRRRAVVLGALGAAGVALALTFWRAPLAAAPAIDKSSIWIERVRRGDLLRQVPVQGTLVPERVQWLSAAQAAHVAEILLRPGAQVEPDSVVVVLENVELELAALEAERQAASAASALIQLDVRTEAEEKAELALLGGLRAELESAERHAASAEQLARQALISDAEHKDSLSTKAGLAARVGAAEQRHHVLLSGRHRQLEAQRAELLHLREIANFRRRQLAGLEVRAGIRGVVQEVPLERGQWVAIGALLAKIAEPGHLKADVKVAEANARDVYRGMPVRFDSPAGNFRGHVERVDPAVVAGSVRLEVLLDEALPSGARTDQAVFGYVELEQLKDVLYVARPAGVQEGAPAGLYRLDPDHTHATRITAQLGRGSAKEVEIKTGLSEGEEIVVSDVSSFEMAPRIQLK